jgi:predicted CoA-binding protein
VTDAAEVLKRTESILLIDWPSRDVPDTLARAGFRVSAQDGPGVEDHNAYEPVGDEVVIRSLGVEPDHADLIYVHRPFDELPDILELAKRLGARAIWSEAGPETEGADRARQLVESAGLRYIDGLRITEAVRQHGRQKFAGGPRG